ncbi:MAG: TIGR00725 family protein [Gemmatimonadota bacterium]
MTGTPRPVRIAVLGAAHPDVEEYEGARRLGRSLAELGAVVLCGGLGGVMEAVARGAREAGGTTVGVLPGPDPRAANEWITLPLATGMGEARNALLVRFGEAAVAVGGAWGTLSEIALARKMGRAVVALGTSVAGRADIPVELDPSAAARWAVKAAKTSREKHSGG